MSGASCGDLGRRSADDPVLLASRTSSRTSGAIRARSSFFGRATSRSTTRSSRTCSHRRPSRSRSVVLAATRSRCIRCAKRSSPIRHTSARSSPAATSTDGRRRPTGTSAAVAVTQSSGASPLKIGRLRSCFADALAPSIRLVIESRDKVVGGEAAAWSTDDGAPGRTPIAKRKDKATRTSTLVSLRPPTSSMGTPADLPPSVVCRVSSTWLDPRRRRRTSYGRPRASSSTPVFSR